MNVMCSVSIGELLDKISILKIKKKNITDELKVKNIQKELDALLSVVDQYQLDETDHFIEELIDINGQLWKIEDDIREKERLKIFDTSFIEIARSVYFCNDKRFLIKNRINEHFGSHIVEVKSYNPY